MTPHEQLLALKEALPADVWPKQIETLPDKIAEKHGEGWCYFIPDNVEHVHIAAEDALPIVTGHAEKWLEKKLWAPKAWGLYWQPYIPRKQQMPMSLIEAVRWEAAHKQRNGEK